MQLTPAAPGGVGKCYSAALRLAVAIAQERSQEPLSPIAWKPGVSPVSLQRWVEQEKARAVSVGAGAAGSGAGPSGLEAPALDRSPRLPHEGLEVAHLAELLRVLG